MPVPETRSTWVELTAFQRDCLEAVARRERDDLTCDPPGIVWTLERRYPRVSRTRLEPNLRTLVERGLLANRSVDDRTTYTLTDEGRALLIQRVERVADACGIGTVHYSSEGAAPSSGPGRRLSDARDGERKRCPDCDAVLPERDPLVGYSSH